MIQPDFLFLSANEAADALGITDARIRQLCIAGDLHGKKLGEKNWAIPACEIDRYKKAVASFERKGPGRPRKSL